MKKFNCFILCFILVFSFASCAVNENSNDESSISYEGQENNAVVLYAPISVVLDEYTRISSKTKNDTAKISNMLTRQEHYASDLDDIKDFIDQIDALMNDLSTSEKFVFKFSEYDLKNIEDLKKAYNTAVNDVKNNENSDNIQIHILAELYFTENVMSNWLETFYYTVNPDKIPPNTSGGPNYDISQPDYTVPEYADYFDYIEKKTAVYGEEIANKLADAFYVQSWMKNQYTIKTAFVFPYGVAVAGYTAENEEWNPGSENQHNPVFMFITNKSQYIRYYLDTLDFNETIEGKGEWSIIGFNEDAKTFKLRFIPLDGTSASADFDISYDNLLERVENNN